MDLPSTPAAFELAAWIGCLFFLVAGWNQVDSFLERRSRRGAPREIQPQPLAVAKFDQPVTESLCQSRRQEVSHERRTDVGELQQKINKVDREVGELRASIELNNQQLTRIDAKLDRVIERQTP